MSRTLNSTIAAGIAQKKLSPFWAVDLLFDSPNELYFWSGLGDLVLDGNTYAGAGTLLGFSDLQENADVSAKGAVVTLSGIDSTLWALVEDEPYQGRKAIVKLGAKAFGAYPTAANTIFKAEMDQLNPEIGAETMTVALKIESRMIDLRKPRLRRYTHVDQQSRFPNDLAFEFVARLQTERGEWKG